jgi:hypothetical protein
MYEGYLESKWWAVNKTSNKGGKLLYKEYNLYPHSSEAEPVKKVSCAVPYRLAEVERTNVINTGESWNVLYLEHPFLELPNTCLSWDIKSFSELYGHRLYIHTDDASQSSHIRTERTVITGTVSCELSKVFDTFHQLLIVVEVGTSTHVLKCCSSAQAWATLNCKVRKLTKWLLISCSYNL